LEYRCNATSHNAVSGRVASKALAQGKLHEARLGCGGGEIPEGIGVALVTLKVSQLTFTACDSESFRLLLTPVPTSLGRLVGLPTVDKHPGNAYESWNQQQRSHRSVRESRKKSAADGDCGAQYALAQELHPRQFPANSFSISMQGEARKWPIQSVENGCVDAMIKIGRICRRRS
jgi:hypothetical protein